MGGNAALPPVNEAVNLLDRLAPDRLASLRDAAPAESRTILTPGVEMGDDERSFPNAALVSHALAGVVIAALDEVIRRTEPALAIARTRLARTSRWRLAAQVLTVLCSSVVVGTALFGRTVWQIVAACLTLVCSITTLLADHVDRLVGAKGGNAGEAFDFLSTSLYPARQLRGEIDVLMRLDPGGPELGKKIGEANALCERISEWLSRI